MYGYDTGRQQIVAGRAQIVAGLEDELGEMAGYGYTGAAPLPPGHPGAPLPPGHPMGLLPPGHPMAPMPPQGRHYGRGFRRDFRRGRHGYPVAYDAREVHPWATPDSIDYPIAATGPVAYDSSSRIRVVDEPPRHERQFPIGFISPQGEPVPADSIQTITTQPQVIFRSERLAVPNSIVLNFQLVDIKVGKDSQLAAPGNLPTECFSNISIGVRMQLDTAEPGITLTLVAQNIDVNNSHPFSSVLYGTVVE